MSRFENHCVHFLLVPASHGTMTSWVKNFCLQNLLNLALMERVLCWSITSDFCPFLGYWLSKNASHAHGTKGEFVSFAKPIVLCTIWKRILTDFCPFWGYWPSKNGSRAHNIKDKFVSLAKLIVFGTTGKRILYWSMIAIEPIANFSLFLGYWPLKKWVTWSWCKGGICFFCKTYHIWYRWKKTFYVG